MLVPAEVAILFRAALLCHPSVFLDNETALPDWPMPTAPSKAAIIKDCETKQLPIFCMRCLHKLGSMEGGWVRSDCHKCSTYGYQRIGWNKISFISSKVGGWGSDRILCQVYEDTPKQLIEAAHTRLIAYYRSHIK